MLTKPSGNWADIFRDQNFHFATKTRKSSALALFNSMTALFQRQSQSQDSQAGVDKLFIV